jgi:hypothetical protein
MSAGKGICPACGREFVLTRAGSIRHHWRGHSGRRKTHPCVGGGSAPALLPPPPPPPTHGRLPISGDRSFTYYLSGQLTRDDVRKIATALLLAHVDGHSEEAWIEAVAAGLVPDLGPT